MLVDYFITINKLLILLMLLWIKKDYYPLIEEKFLKMIEVMVFRMMKKV